MDIHALNITKSAVFNLLDAVFPNPFSDFLNYELFNPEAIGVGSINSFQHLITCGLHNFEQQ